jgi:hypothetical protein
MEGAIHVGKGMSPATKTILINGGIVLGVVLGALYVHHKWIQPKIEAAAAPAASTPTKS